MSLRPRTPGTRTTLAQSRMAPGGRRWSESPIPRVATRRVRTAKQAPGTPDAFTYVYGYSDATPGSPENHARYAATVNPVTVLDTYDTHVTGDMLAVVMVTEAVATPPAGWTLLHSNRFTHFGYYVAGISATPGMATAWALDWAGVTGLGECAYFLARFFRTAGTVGGLTWEARIASFEGVSSGTWPVPSDASWKYSLPAFVSEDCNYDDSYTYNSFGAGNDISTFKVLDTNAAVGPYYCTNGALFPLASTYAIDAVNSFGDIWRPDQAFVMDTAGFAGLPSVDCILLGLK